MGGSTFKRSMFHNNSLIDQMPEQVDEVFKGFNERMR